MTDNPQKYDDLATWNNEEQKVNLATHTGVPISVFNGEPFFGQDRMDMLISRLKTAGMTKRSNDE